MYINISAKSFELAKNGVPKIFEIYCDLFKIGYDVKAPW
jgi:hypothetical protein